MKRFTINRSHGKGVIHSKENWMVWLFDKHIVDELVEFIKSGEDSGSFFVEFVGRDISAGIGTSKGDQWYFGKARIISLQPDRGELMASGPVAELLV